MLSLDEWLEALQPGVDTLRVVPKGARWRVVSVSRDPDSILLRQNHPRNLGHTYELSNRAMIQHSRELSETDPPPRARESYRKPERPPLPPGYIEISKRTRPTLATTPRRPRHAVCYRCYDRHDVLLYVGYTVDPVQRMNDHANLQPWWGEVARTFPTWYDTEEEAAAAEDRAIKTEFPVYNVQGVLTPYRSPLRGTA
jgi:hypothetical protein